MRLSAGEFMSWPRKALTFIGMSGVGKTYLSGLLEREGWSRYSCDYEIGARHMRAAMAETLDTPDDIGALSRFLGKLGNPERGGLGLEEFKKRQRLYYDAECAAIAGVGAALAAAPGHFVHDSTGSLCEILDEAPIRALGRQTLFVYLKAGPEEEETVRQRARTHPKPLFFPPQEFERWVGEYLAHEKLGIVEGIEPDEFARWVFPRLFESRLPKYRGLADLYGVSVDTASLRGVRDEQDLMERIAGALENR